MRKELSKHFTKVDIQMVTKHMKKCSTKLVIREMHILNHSDYHYTPITLAKIKGLNIQNAGKYVLVGMQLRETLAVSQKLSIQLPCDHA